VDDWIETASQALAGRDLIEDCGAQWAGLTVLVDQAEPANRMILEPFAAVVAFEALPPSVG
jgi:adenine phosphoribosyltransferase